MQHARTPLEAVGIIIWRIYHCIRIDVESSATGNGTIVEDLDLTSTS